MPEDEPMLSYNDEGMVNGAEFRPDPTSEDEEAESGEEEEEDDDENGEGDESEHSGDEGEGGEEAEGEDEEGSDEDDNDSLSDLRLHVSDDEAARNDKKEEDESRKPLVVRAKSAKPDLKQLKDMMEQARKELPYTFSGIFYINRSSVVKQNSSFLP
jgi:hypothetical protein